MNTEHIYEVKNKILDVIAFKIKETLTVSLINIFLAMENRASHIYIEYQDGKEKIVDLTKEEVERIFNNLKKKNFEFPGYVQSLTIEVSIGLTVPKFVVEYYPIEGF